MKSMHFPMLIWKIGIDIISHQKRAEREIGAQGHIVFESPHLNRIPCRINEVKTAR